MSLFLKPRALVCTLAHGEQLFSEASLGNSSAKGEGALFPHSPKRSA